MEEKMLESLLEKTKYDLFHYHEKHGKEKIKYSLKRLLKPKDTPKVDPYFWPQALLTQTLETAEQLEILVKYYDDWYKSGTIINHIDNIMNGYSLVYVYEKTGNVRYKEMMDKLYDYLSLYYKEHGNTMPYRRNHTTHVYVDGLGMTVPFLCRYGETFGVREAVELGQKLLLDFLEKGMEETTGLPYHGYDLKTGVKYGVVGWGRAVGWLLLGMVDSIEFMRESREKEVIVKAFQELAKNSFQYFQESGYFTWQLPAKEGPIDTSATGMIAYAIAKGKRTAYLRCDCEMDEIMGKTISADRLSIEEALKRMERALSRSYREGQIVDSSGECEGFSRYPQIYGSYPWSNGPTLRFLWERKK